MIERGIIKERIKRLNIKKNIRDTLRKSAGVGSIDIEPTPLGERITLHAVRPGLVIGSGGKNIKDITQDLRTKFQLECRSLTACFYCHVILRTLYYLPLLQIRT